MKRMNTKHAACSRPPGPGAGHRSSLLPKPVHTGIQRDKYYVTQYILYETFWRLTLQARELARASVR